MFFGSPVRVLRAQLRADDAGQVPRLAWALLDELRLTADQPAVRTGFVHVDSTDDPYTSVVTAISRVTDDDFVHEVHGYYWAVLLGPGHLKMLGGEQQFRRTAPCAEVHPVPIGGAEGLLCVLTADPLDAGESDYRAWRRALAPVRRQGYPGIVEYLGRRSSLSSWSSRPVWLPM